MNGFGRTFVAAAVVVIFLTVTGFAQAECEVTYQKLLDNRKGPEVEKLKTALTAANDYLAKCSNAEGQEKIKEYVTKQIPKLTEIIKTTELVNRFNAGVQARNWDDTMASGKELIAINLPATLDIMIVLASIGTNDTSGKYASDSAGYAQQVLDKLKSDGTSTAYGAYQVSYKTRACPDGKVNTVSWMNYIIGAHKQTQQKQPKEALPHYYNAITEGCELKDSPEIYRTIGSWFTNEAIRLSKERDEKIKAAGNQETEETKTAFLLIRGYLDRAIDAYARAVSSAPSKNLSQERQASLKKTLQDLYESRFDGKVDGLDKVIAEAMSKPFIDPVTPVAPAKDYPVQAVPTAAVPPKKP